MKRQMKPCVSACIPKSNIPATSGNVYHYQQWALEVSGTGAAKVFPLADGPGTVTVLVVDSDKKISSSLPGRTAEAYIETMRRSVLR